MEKEGEKGAVNSTSEGGEIQSFQGMKLSKSVQVLVSTMKG